MTAHLLKVFFVTVGTASNERSDSASPKSRHCELAGEA